MPMFAAAVALLLASVAGQAVGAAQGSIGLSAFAAAAFAGGLIRLAWQLNAPWWTRGGVTGPSAEQGLPLMASRNAQLLALGYGWGGASLLAVYLLTPVRWQHGWQYGCGMVLIAAVIAWGGQRLAANWRPGLARVMIGVSFVHGWAATAGLFWLISTGKMLSIKGDWAANVVFVAGALIIGFVSSIAIRTTRLLEQARQARHQTSPLA